MIILGILNNISNTNNNFQQSFEGRFPNGLKKPRHIKSYKANIQFSTYNPKIKDFGHYRIPVHNEEIYKRLQPQYTANEFEALFNFTKKKGTFDYIIEGHTGFIKTSFINRKENPLMSDLIWITDTCNNMVLVKAKNPQDCTKVLNKMADLYSGQQKNFDTVISNPSKYKKNGFWPADGQVGIGHCFEPKTKNPHIWFAKTRLESIGNYLQTVADIISTGFRNGNYGYKSAADIPDVVINSISNSVKYLKVINYPYARSCGAWEEQTFANSLTSDTAIINKGLSDVIDLMYSPSKNNNLALFRKRVLNSKHGNVFKDKKALEDLLKEGQKRVAEQPYLETSTEQIPRHAKKKYYERENDAAMSFIPQMGEIYTNNPIKDSIKKIFLLNKISNNLVRPNGAIRYKDDRYLNLDYHTLKDKGGNNKKSNEAQWFLVSEISAAYGKILECLLKYYQKSAKPNMIINKLASLALKGETEYINRSYARITPKKMVKANGYTCPAYKVPEAYEAVTLKNGKIKYVPGAHPLTWAESSLYKASELYLKNLQKLAELDL